MNAHSPRRPDSGEAADQGEDARAPNKGPTGDEGRRGTVTSGRTRDAELRGDQSASAAGWLRRRGERVKS